MRIPIAAALLVVAVPLAATAGEIYGSTKPQAPGLEIMVTCGDFSQTFFADPRGSYRIYIPRKGDCRLSARRGSEKWSEPLPIYSSERPTRYDFEIHGTRLERQ